VVSSANSRAEPSRISRSRATTGLSSFAARYNAEWLVEKNGFRSPLDARAARLDTNLRRAA
jgi:hypothetical protein